MKTPMRVVLIGLLLLTTALAAFSPSTPVAQANSSLPEGCVSGSLPTHDPKYPPDQQILICIPDFWNGQLVVYAHGYVAPQVPLALPLDELTLSDGRTVPEVLLPLGFAFATTSYHKNGYAVEQAVDDIKFLVKHFKTLVPPDSLQKVIVAGASEGGLITTMLIERFPGKYDAGLALCGPVNGAPDQIRYTGDFRVVFDYFFPGVFIYPPGSPDARPFGAADVPEDAFLYWESFYVPRITNAILADLTSGGLATTQLFNVTGAAFVPADVNTILTTAVSRLFYSIVGTNDFISTAGGMPYDNQSSLYAGSSDDAALNAGVERVAGAPRAQAYIRRFYQTNAELEKHLVSMHTTLDGVVPFQHELDYQQRVALAGRSQFLTLIPVDRYGHCTFTAEEILGAFALLQ